jgi:hypothetical protein
MARRFPPPWSAEGHNILHAKRRFSMTLTETPRLADTLELTADLTTLQLAEALAGLRFRGNSRCLVSLDRDVRDYLLRALAPR